MGEDSILPSFPISAPRPGAIVVSVQGEIDLITAPMLREALTAADARRPQVLIVDFAEVSFMDSTGMHALVHSNNRAKANGYPMVITGLHQPKRALEIAGLLKELEIAEDVGEVLAHFGDGHGSAMRDGHAERR